MPYRLDTAHQVFFYCDEFYCLNNFSSFRVLFRGTDFDTAEHAYHYQKFPAYHGDILAKIRSARSAHDAYKIAGANVHLVHTHWVSIRVSVMDSILRAKLAQHEYVRRKLLETGDRVLIEDSWRDVFWGWGKHRDGINMLGQLWMRIRDELQQRL